MHDYRSLSHIQRRLLWMLVCMYVWLCVCMYVCVVVCMCAWLQELVAHTKKAALDAGMYACVMVCIYVYMYV